MMRKLKSLVLPDRAVRCPILRGPFRGAQVMMNPQTSLRYIFGIYEHELNGWMAKVCPRVNTLFDVGANHGFFAFGVMAAWKRLQKIGKVWAFEPQSDPVQLMRTALPWNERPQIEMVIENCFVGSHSTNGTIALDDYLVTKKIPADSITALIKIDVEGAELEVLKGAQKLVRAGNLFLVEIHSASLLTEVQQFFSDHGHPVDVVCQKPFPVLGREKRSEDNWWIISRL